MFSCCIWKRRRRRDTHRKTIRAPPSTQHVGLLLAACYIFILLSTFTIGLVNIWPRFCVLVQSGSIALFYSIANLPYLTLERDTHSCSCCTCGGLIYWRVIWVYNFPKKKKNLEGSTNLNYPLMQKKKKLEGEFLSMCVCVCVMTGGFVLLLYWINFPCRKKTASQFYFTFLAAGSSTRSLSWPPSLAPSHYKSVDDYTLDVYVYRRVL